MTFRLGFIPISIAAKMFKEYVISDKQTSQSRIAGKSIAAKVEKAAGVNGGLSGEVSRNRRGK